MKPVFNRFTLRQTLVIVTLVAIVVAILRELQAGSVLAYGILLAPVVLYTLAHVLAIVIRPVGYAANRPTSVQSLCLLIPWTLAIFFGLGTLLALLPLAVFWMPQFVVTQRIQAFLTHYGFLSESAYRAEIGRRSGLVLGIFSLILLVPVCVLWSHSRANHITGHGTALGNYWVVFVYGGTMEYQCAEGYEDIDWQWTSGPLRSLTLPIDRDAGFLGITRYRIDNCVKVRLPFWLQAAILCIAPTLWFVGAVAHSQHGDEPE